MPLNPRRRRWTGGVTAVAVAMISVAVLGHAAATPASAAVRQPTTPAAAQADQPPLTTEQALAQAKATGTAVPVDGATTATDTVVANPDGTLTVTTSPVPVRKRVGAAWTGLDPTLSFTAGGTVAPAVTTTGLTLSGGGGGPLATMRANGRSLSLTAPMTLPAPTLSGSTATYANVLSGVDLVVTVDQQGGFSSVLVVHSAQAAGNPDLTSLTFPAQTTGVTLTTDADGNIAATDSVGRAVFTGGAPSMWDSRVATPPGGTVTDANGGVTVDADTGRPVGSSAAGPGESAHTAAVGTSATATSVTLTPDRSLFTALGVQYPVFVDPYWSAVGGAATGWASVAKQYGGTNYWNKSPDPQRLMQVGNVGSIWSHTLLNFGIDLGTLRGATIASAQLNTTDVYSYSCSARGVEVYAPATTLNSSNATWNFWAGVNKGGLVASANVAYGHSSSCPAHGVGFNVTGAVAAAVAANRGTQTFLLQASNEAGDVFGWKEFAPPGKAGAPTLSITYNHPPDTPRNLSTSPPTSCTANPPTVVGDGAVTLYAPVSDRDSGNLGVTFQLVQTATGTVVASSDASLTYFSGTTAVLVVPAAKLSAAANGAITQFSWRVQVTDFIAAPSAWSTTCGFAFDPTRPGHPDVAAQAPATMHKAATFSVTRPAGTAPSGYLYQLNGTAPATVAADASGNATITVTPPRFTNVLTVTTLSPGGNIGDTASLVFNATPDPTVQADQDLTGDNVPDLVTVGGGNGVPAGLWLAPGRAKSGSVTGTGQVVSAAADIGANGNGFDASPAAFTGAQVVTGHFTGSGVQDLFAYYPGGPNAGGGVVEAGNGDGSVLRPQDSGTTHTLSSGTLSDDNGDNPLQVADAGDASGRGLAYPDLIAISGDPASGWYLEYIASQNGVNNYMQPVQLPTATPTGGTDWNNWTVTACQVAAGTATHTALFLWNRATGALSLWTDLAFDLGTGTLSYTPYTIAGSGWNTGAPVALQAADVNGDGTADLYTVGAAAKVTAYLVTLPGTATAQPTQDLLTSAHTWPLTDTSTGGVTTAADVTGTLPLTGTAGAAWHGGDLFSPDVVLDGKGGALSTGTAAVDTTLDFSVSAWVKPAALGGAVVSEDGTHNSALVLYPDPTSRQWTFGMSTSDTATAYQYTHSGDGTVALGTWTHLTATYNHTTGTMALYVNGNPAGSGAHTNPWKATGKFQIGQLRAGDTYGSFFNGQVANVQVWTQTLNPTQVASLSGTPGYVILPNEDTGYTSGTWSTRCATLTFNTGLLTLTRTCGQTGTITYGAAGKTGAVLTLQPDGNLVIYANAARSGVIWASGTAASPHDVLFLSDDGELGLYNDDGSLAWTSVWLRAHANNQYVDADGAGSFPLIANRAAPGVWETYDVLGLGGGNIALRAHANQDIVTADNAGASPLIANRVAIGPWETFLLVRNGDGSVSLRAAANGRYVTAENGGANALIANRTAIGVWESFDLIGA